MVLSGSGQVIVYHMKLECQQENIVDLTFTNISLLSFIITKYLAVDPRKALHDI